MLQEVRQHSWIVPLSGSAPKVNWVYSGLRPVISPSFVEIYAVVFV